MRCKSRTFIFVLVALCLILALPGYAQEANNNFLETILDPYANNAAGWEAPLKQIAMRLFGMLALIQIAWVFGQLMFNKGDFWDWAQEALKQMVGLGFLYALLAFGSTWTGAIIQSFRQAGSTASGAVGGATALNPSNFFEAGANIVTSLWHSMQFNLLSPTFMTDNLAIILSGLLIMIAFAIIAALEVVVLVESYFYIYTGVLFLGFGGSQWTRDIALRYLMGLIAVGAKLFAIQLIIGLAQDMVFQWEDQIKANTGPMLENALLIKMVGGSIVFLALAKMIPDLVQGMINGASYSTGRPLTSTMAAAPYLAAAATTGGLAAGAGAVGMAATAMGAPHVGASAGAAAASLGGSTARNLGRAMYALDGGMSQFMPSQHKPSQSKSDDPSYKPNDPGSNAPIKRIGEEGPVGNGNTISN